VALSERFKERGVVVVGVALREPADAVRAFAKEFGIRFPLWIDPDGRGPAAFGVYGHPATILIDRAGRLVGRARGERDWATDDARRLVDALLALGR
jgi:peroxiredoxin